MRHLVLLLLFAATFPVGSVGNPPGPGQRSYCPDCHQKIFAQYRASRMAIAARTPAFLQEAAQGEGPCLACHAPSGGEGVGCVDCHGGQGHPYPKLKLPAVCSRCHDAPGEVTVRSYRISPAARRGQGCLDCHLRDGRGSHAFRGPTSPGFLQGVASLGVSMRWEGEGYTALIRVRHRAGHALPGGTTGRSVWLLVRELGSDGKLLKETRFRFGWLHARGAGWEDRTLPPGPGRVIEVPLSGNRTKALHADLLYRFRPGGLEQPDPDQVLLDRAEFVVPGR